MPAPPLPILFAEDTPFSEYSAAVWGRVFNAMRDFHRRPVAVVQATHRAHVVEAVKLAKEKGWRVSVRSGGHSWAAWSVRDEALLIDLGGFGKDEGGEDGLVYDKSTGVNWGWACENIVAIDVVTADGNELRCSETENPDLFWAARGSGPGFPAVVVRFHLRTRPLSGMYQSLYFYSLDRFEEILNWVIKICPTAPPSTEIVLLTLTPPGADAPQVMANFLSFKPDPEDLIPLHSSHPSRPLQTVFANPTSLPQQYVDQDASNPPAHRYISENSYVSNDADVPKVLKKAFTTLPTPQSFALYFAMNPCSRRVQLGSAAANGDVDEKAKTMPDMALSMQSDHYFALYTIYPDAEDDERCHGWVQDVMKDVEKKSVGSYLGDADFRHRRTKFWGDEQGKKLMQIRKEWDPEGRICGYLDADDKSGAEGLKNEFEWA
ncbi:FAD binding domain protein [Colletotrichum chrysophilum]|uniref:FAD binding domain protein n=1 Tax=Colletotrichum chrysophilum TaxID=1836956 RepID=A0AAD9EQA2_9PEZI|nr:FAD binding domain protein [Colletotrichum chrysophilum]